jgi:hypothetical protein
VAEEKKPLNPNLGRGFWFPCKGFYEHQPQRFNRTCCRPLLRSCSRTFSSNSRTAFANRDRSRSTASSFALQGALTRDLAVGRKFRSHFAQVLPNSARLFSNLLIGLPVSGVTRGGTAIVPVIADACGFRPAVELLFRPESFQPASLFFHSSAARPSSTFSIASSSLRSTRSRLSLGISLSASATSARRF